MQCPACGTINPAQARFCMGCGYKLIQGIICTTCHTLLPPQARYCTHCGAFVGQYPCEGLGEQSSQTFARVATIPKPHPVVAPPATAPTEMPQAAPPITAAEALPQASTALAPLPEARPLEDLRASLKRYLPDELYEPLERRPKDRDFDIVRDHLADLLKTIKTYLPQPVWMQPQPAGEPRGGMERGVFLFGDVSGFTPLSEALKRVEGGAERVAEIIDSLFTELVRALFDHGGVLLKFGGDALLGVFPATTDDEMRANALKASQAALALLDVMKQDKYAAIEAAGETRALLIKCGISAGPYFAAHIGVPPNPRYNDENGLMAYVTTGHTVNLAEEAEGHANPGEAAMTRATYELLGDAVTVDAVTKEPDDDYVRLVAAPQADQSALERTVWQEPPAGDIQQQITYLVDRLDRLTPYLSDELVARIKDNPGSARIVPEYRPVTSMFVNYKGISALIEKLGDTSPDTITKQLNDYFHYMADIVQGYGGTLARMDQYAIGDRLVIFFGAPVAHDDDPALAVYAAMDMQRAVRKHFSALRTAAGVFRFEQRVGINTGFLFSGNAGALNLRQEYTLMGDDINMAARLMSYAKWGSVYISNKTEEQVRAHFTLSDRFDLKVKGKQILIPTYEVLGKREVIGATRGLAGNVAPLTGRDEALTTLQAKGNDLLQNKRGQIIAIFGDSGLGKSRLKREFKTWMFEQPAKAELIWVEAQSMSFSEPLNYWLAAQVLRGVLRLPPEATEEDILFTLWERGEALLEEEAMDAIPFLAHLMGLELGEEWAWVTELAPKIRQKQTFWAAREFFTGLAKQHPLVIALDDLHWADEASLALFEELMGVADHAPIMLLLVSRVIRDKGCWRLRNAAAGEYPHRFTEITLKPLAAGDTRDLLTALLPGAQFDARLRTNILEKAAGNPFYLEEVVRTLIDSGGVIQNEDGTWTVIPEKVADIEVPSTLQAAIVARIDRLAEDCRQALQKAAVIGRQFQLAVFRELTKADEQIDTWLAQLERGGLLRPEHAADVDYAFPDALVHEVAYNSLLVKHRREFHGSIGRTLESLYADKLEAHCDLLAYHFHRSDDDESAVKYLEMAAKKARNEYANLTAIERYKELLERREQQGDQKGQANALYQMGVIAYEIGDYAQAKPWLERAVALYEASDDQANVGWSVMYVGMVDLKQANYDAAIQHHTQALELAESRNDTFQAGIHMTNLARVLWRMGAYARSLEMFEKSLALKKQNNDLTGQGFAHFYMALVYIDQGRDTDAETALQACHTLWEQVPNNARVISYYQQGMGLLALHREWWEQAVEHLRQALDISEKLVLKAEIIENLSYLGRAYLGQGQLDEALEVSQRAVTLLGTQKDVEEAQKIALNHAIILSALEASEAETFLQQAYDEMQSQANRLAREKDRTIFLEQVRVNQEIAAARNALMHTHAD
ncbi:MAG: tetratricopeptide repeat protein [Anaerolineae bacterium]